MKRTSVTVLLLVALAGGAGGFLLDHALTVSGRATFTPALGLPLLLALLAVAVLALGWTVRRSIRSPEHPRMNPFRALRIAVLARASSLVGALLLGFAAGALAYISTRPVGPPIGSVLALTATLGAALVLVIAALVAEHFCTLPTDSDGPDSPGALKGDDDEHPRPAGHPAH
ncbi:hypothetical protein JOD62_000949 [Microbacterium keratanolyticum]|uniref:DUF3180 domain-containing protein n=1 Tax=Microbacterium keratanolyticum TaxID=67574 RepID=A0A9W6HQD8_9MICO|nr:DUF3180 domain-containing protein [Microbacterium keratanolyticum]MBM7468401.1 hypothetical protein [Microbacterium keratanolyticum]GLK00475.1 hypothetical protein GCM10017596_01900 [Microbacterium keratanolyticum]